MTVTKIHVIAVIATIVMIATTTTMTSFLSVTPALATPLTFGTSGQAGNDTTSDTTITSPMVGQQQHSIYITKDGTNSYFLSGGSTSVSSFDTTYRIAGERSAIKSAENLIATTVTDDFKESPTIGYVEASNMTNATSAAAGATLPNPFASPEQISERITSELSRVIGEVENNTPQGQLVEIKCDFGMTLDDMRCHTVPSTGAGSSAGMTSTNTTGTTANATESMSQLG
ncbi:MAG: hypothetical protein ACJ701_04790 [Nitrososphaera sp.]